ncbi:MAG: GNAT family N-acetyltransferase [Betaproteobacteria bacterium]
MNEQTVGRADALPRVRLTTSEVQRVTEGARALLAAHFLALPPEDRRLRFGASLSGDSVIAYADRIDFGRDAVFGVFDNDLAAVGIAHVAFGPGNAELGLSVLPGQRGRGAGSALFARAAEHVRNRSVSSLFMHCLAENAAIMHIARKSGMHIVAAAGDVDAHLSLAPASPLSITGEYLVDRLALYDYALKSHVSTLRRINTALEEA